MKRFVPESRELQVYRSLQGRKSFMRNEQIAFYNARQGYEGEKSLSSRLAKQLRSDHIALYDILLDNNGTLYQLDCLLIFPNRIIMLEVKNHKGEFEFREEKLYSYTVDKYYPNPLHQLQRSEINLRELLSSISANLPLESYVVYVNQEFTLFNERNPTIILPSQINTFIQQLNHIPGKINSRDKMIAEKIIAAQIDQAPYERLPNYQFDEVLKGVLCQVCRSTMRKHKRELHCPRCFYREPIDSGVLRSVIEFNILFPELKITTPQIAAWCALEISDRSIRRILKAYLYCRLHTNSTYYTFEK